MNKEYILLIIVLLIIGLLIGYTAGTIITIKAVVAVASSFIDVDYDLVQKAIFQYKNNIGKCFPSDLGNASLYIG